MSTSSVTIHRCVDITISIIIAVRKLRLGCGAGVSFSGFEFSIQGQRLRLGARDQSLDRFLKFSNFGLHKEHHNILGSILGSSYFGNLPFLMSLKFGVWI